MVLMRRFIPAVLIVVLLALISYSYVNAGSHKARADELQVELDKARAACTRVNDMMPLQASRAMWPEGATPDEKLTFVLDQKQRELDARAGHSGARLSIRFMDTLVASNPLNSNSPRQQSLPRQE